VHVRKRNVTPCRHKAVSEWLSVKPKFMDAQNRICTTTPSWVKQTIRKGLTPFWFINGRRITRAHILCCQQKQRFAAEVPLPHTYLPIHGCAQDTVTAASLCRLTPCKAQACQSAVFQFQPQRACSDVSPVFWHQLIRHGQDGLATHLSMHPFSEITMTQGTCLFKTLSPLFNEVSIDVHSAREQICTT